MKSRVSDEGAVEGVPNGTPCLSTTALLGVTTYIVVVRWRATQLVPSSAGFAPMPPSLASHAVVHFESIVLQDQRIRGADDDYLLSVVHLTIQHPDARWCPGCLATIRHRFRGANGGAVEVNIRAADQCVAYERALAVLVENYYRERVGTEGTAIRVGPRGASPWLVGMQRMAPATAVLGTSEPRQHRSLS